jgi:hypothetical protein
MPTMRPFLQVGGSGWQREAVGVRGQWWWEKHEMCRPMRCLAC